jgi:hypothetical protein
MFVSDFREVTCDFALVPFSPPPPPLVPFEEESQNSLSRPEQRKKPLVRISWARQSDEHIIRFQYLKKNIFNIIASKTTTKAEHEEKKENHPEKESYFTIHGTQHKVSERNETFLSHSFSFFFVSLVEIYNQANARNKSGVMYKSHLNAQLQQDVLFALSFIKH